MTDKTPDRPVDKQGRPLRERKLRDFGRAPFKGLDGKPHPRTPRLKARQHGFDDIKKQTGYHKPGSLKK